MKKFIFFLIIALMVLCFGACGGGGEAADSAQNGENESQSAPFDYDAVPDEMDSPDGTYSVAMISDIGTPEDKGFNRAIWNGVKRYAFENDKSYKYYVPANLNVSGDSYDAFEAAVKNGAELVVCAGRLQKNALAKAAYENPDVKFVFIDGIMIEGADGKPLTNVAPFSFREDQAAYLAGYAAVMEGYTKFGFSGGGGGKNEVIYAYCYGFAKGLSDAAQKLGVEVETNLTWKYGETYQSSPELEKMYSEWYDDGVEVIFPCGGKMCNSAFAAAAKYDGRVIGVDVDQSSHDPSVITSALKSLSEAAMYACNMYYSGRWEEICGDTTILSLENDGVGLPSATWSMKKFTLEDYRALVNEIKAGKIDVDASGKVGIDYSRAKFPNLKINVIK